MSDQIKVRRPTWQQEVYAEAFVARVAELVKMCSLDGFIPRDPILVVEAMVAHMLGWRSGSLLIMPSEDGSGVRCSFKAGQGPVPFIVASAASTGPYAFTTALSSLFASLDDIGTFQVTSDDD